MNKIISIMKKKFVLPALILTIISLVIITLLLNSYNNKRMLDSYTQKNQAMPQQARDVNPSLEISPQAQSILTLSPNPASLDSNGNGTINVDIQTNSNEVTAIQLELQYDPKAVKEVNVKASRFFSKPIELMKKIDKQKGRITYMLGISPTQQPVKGNGVVAEITFTKVPGTKLRETEFVFFHSGGSESIVAAAGIDKSVLKKTYDTKILLSQ
jgi:hypothetical protein